jgi:hypothetical protein
LLARALEHGWTLRTRAASRIVDRCDRGESPPTATGWRPTAGTGVVARPAESFAFTRLQTNRPAATRPIPSGCDEDLLVHVVGGFPVLTYDVAEPPHRDGLAVELTLENRGPPTVFFGQVAVKV